MKSKNCLTPVKNRLCNLSLLFVFLLVSSSLEAQITEEELMRMLEGDDDYIGTATIGLLQGGVL